MSESFTKYLVLEKGTWSLPFAQTFHKSGKVFTVTSPDSYRETLSQLNCDTQTSFRKATPEEIDKYLLMLALQ